MTTDLRAARARRRARRARASRSCSCSTTSTRSIDAVHEDLERLARFPPPALRLVIITRADPPIGLGRLRLDGSLTEIRAADLALLARRGRRAVRRARHRARGRGPRDALAAHRGLGGRAAPRGGVAAAPSRPARLHRALRRHRRHGQRLPGQRGARPPATASCATSCCARRSSTRSAPSWPTRSPGATGRPRDAGAPGARRRAHDGRSTSAARGIATTRCSPSCCAPSCARSSPMRSPQLHRRAATWLAAHGDDAARAAPRGRGRRLGSRGRPHHRRAGSRCWSTARWARCGPSSRRCRASCVEASPELALAFGGALLARGDHAGAQPYLRRAEEGEALVRAGAAARSSPPAGPRWRLYEGRLRGDPRRRAAGRARAARAQPRVLDSGELSSGVRSFVLGQLGIVELWTGDLDAATAHLERAHASAVDGADDWTALAAGAHLAVARAFRGELAARAAPRRRGRRLAERRGWARSEPAGAAYCVQAAVAIQRGPPRRGRGARGARLRGAARDARAPAARGACPQSRAAAARRRRARGGARRPAGRARRGRRLAAARPAGGPAARPGGAAARRASASASGRARCSSAPSARPRRRSRSPTPWPGCACWRATRARRATLLAPHLGRRRRRRRPWRDAGVGPRRGVAARRAGARRARRARRRRALAGALARSRRAGRPAPAHRRARQSSSGRCCIATCATGRHTRRSSARRSRRSSTAAASGHARSPCCWPSRSASASRRSCATCRR